MYVKSQCTDGCTDVKTKKTKKKSGNQLHEGKYGEWLALHEVLAGNCMFTNLFIHAWNHCYTINVVSSSGVVVTCTHERIILDF